MKNTRTITDMTDSPAIKLLSASFQAFTEDADAAAGIVKIIRASSTALSLFIKKASFIVLSFMYIG